MTREEIARALSAIEHAMQERVHVWRIFIDRDGREVQRFHTGSFQRSPRAVRAPDDPEVKK